MFYIEYKDKQSGQDYTKYFNYKPNVTNAYCPYCGNQVMDRQVIVEPIVETRVYYECLHCGKNYEEYDTEFIKANSKTLDPIIYLDVYETDTSEVHAKTQVIINNNISDTVHKIQDIDNAVINNYPIPTEEPVQLFTALDRIEDLAQNINIFTYKPLLDALIEFALLLTTVDIKVTTVNETVNKIKGRLIGIDRQLRTAENKLNNQFERDYHEGYCDAIFNIIALAMERK